MTPIRFVTIATLLGSIVSLGAPTSAPAATHGLHADFNGDGYADLAVGIPYDDNGVRGGGVQVLYGRKGGLSSTGSQLWTQNTLGIPDATETDDLFGDAIAAGDFDHDGFDDLAVGVPQETIGGVWSAGAVHVLYGSTTGLKSVRTQLWTQDGDGIVDAVEPGDRFGAALTADDFNDDGYDDLAVGVPGESGVGYDKERIGAAHVLYGSYAGLDDAFNQLWTQDSPDVEGVAERFDQLGETLASGDFDGDGHADLAIAAVYEDVGTRVLAGSVNVLYGSYYRLTATGNRLWHRDLAGMGGAAAYQRFGAALGAGDFDGDGYGDLAVGAPTSEVVEGNVGSVDLLYGSPAGLGIVRHQVLHEALPGVLGTPSMNDLFGHALAAGDWNHDGRDDLAVGVPGETISGKKFAGAVHVFHGASTGLNDLDGLVGFSDQVWTQGSPGIEGAVESDDHFGEALTTGDFDGDGTDDLAIGVFGEAIGKAHGAGAVNVLYGRVGGITSSRDQVFHQGSAGIAGDPLANDWFGARLGR